MFNNLKKLSKHLKGEIKIYQLVLKDKRAPRIGKIFLGLAIGYFFLPFDLIPDFIPILGQLDDLLIVPILLWLSFRFIPKELIEEYRNKV